MGQHKKILRAYEHQPAPNEETESISGYAGPAILPILLDDPARAKALLDLPPRTVQTTKDAIDILCRFPLDQYMGIDHPRSFCCPFHHDKHPSASIYTLPENGHNLMSCVSECSRTWDIIGVTRQHYGISFEKALNALTYVFNLTVEHPYSDTSNYISQMQSNLTTIQEMIQQPDLHKLLSKNYSSLSPYDIMVHFLNTAIRLHKDRQDVRDSRGYPIFFLSVRELHRQMTGLTFGDNASGVISAKITMLCWLGLLEKIPTQELSKEVAARAALPQNDYRKKDLDRYGKSAGNRISFFRIPAYDADHIEHILQQSKRWTVLGYTIKNIRYETILKREGMHVADRVYAGRYIRKPKEKKDKRKNTTSTPN